VTVLVWLAQQYAGIGIPGDVAAALTTLVSFGVAYVVPGSSG
jgi:hypothetical protein